MTRRYVDEAMAAIESVDAALLGTETVSLALARLKLESGAPDEAEALAQAAVSANPQSGEANLQLAAIFQATSRKSDARTAALAAADAAPGNARLIERAGQLLERQGDCAEARRLYRAALGLDAGCKHARRRLRLWPLVRIVARMRR